MQAESLPTMQTPMQTDLPPDRPGPDEPLLNFISRHYGRHPSQLAFLEDDARYRFACSGVGGGKSEVGAFDAVRYCIRFPGIAGIIVAPTHRMLERSTLIALRKILRWWGDSLPWEHLKSEQKIIFPDHVGPNQEPSTIFLAHCQDPDTLRGPDVAFFFGDEAAIYREETWMVLLGRTRQPGYPHRGWLCSTPKGQNWLYKTFVAGRDEWTDEKRAQYGLHHWQTKDNPLYETDPDFIDALKVAYGEGSDFWRQEVEAEFVSFAGHVYRAWDEETMIVTKDQLPKAFDRLVCGVDWGVSSPGSFELLGLADGITYLLDEAYERGKIISGSDGNDWLSEAKTMQAHWAERAPGTPVKFFADPEDANAIETFRRAGLSIEKANNKRIPGVRACQAVLTGNTFRVLEDAAPHWLAEVTQYHWQEDRDGNPKEDADPAKEFDHAMDAWRYAQIEISGADPAPQIYEL